MNIYSESSIPCASYEIFNWTANWAIIQMTFFVPSSNVQRPIDGAGYGVGAGVGAFVVGATVVVDGVVGSCVVVDIVVVSGASVVIFDESAVVVSDKAPVNEICITKY